METSLVGYKTDEELLHGYDRNIERLYAEFTEFDRINSCGGVTPLWTFGHFELFKIDKKNEIDAAERTRKALLDRMSLKKPKEVWYKNPLTIGIITNLITGVISFLVGYFLKKIN